MYKQFIFTFIKLYHLVCSLSKNTHRNKRQKKPQPLSIQLKTPYELGVAMRVGFQSIITQINVNKQSL